MRLVEPIKKRYASFETIEEEDFNAIDLPLDPSSTVPLLVHIFNTCAAIYENVGESPHVAEACSTRMLQAEWRLAVQGFFKNTIGETPIDESTFARPANNALVQRQIDLMADEERHLGSQTLFMRLIAVVNDPQP